MKEAEEILIFNEKSNVIAMNSITEFEEKVVNLEKIIQEKNEEILRLSVEKQEEISKINDLQAELNRKLEEKDNEVSELSAKIAGEANKNVELQEEINAKIQRLELMPLGNKVIILPYPENPWSD
jgi:predicted RNase H-like nuclease (RuvC/YqgF family)